MKKIRYALYETLKYPRWMKSFFVEDMLDEVARRKKNREKNEKRFRKATKKIKIK